jgi:hypothetical protein
MAGPDCDYRKSYPRPKPACADGCESYVRATLPLEHREMFSMKPAPASAARFGIAQRIDRKARAIRDGRGRWKPEEMLAEMKLALPYEGNEDDNSFAEHGCNVRPRARPGGRTHTCRGHPLHNLQIAKQFLRYAYLIMYRPGLGGVWPNRSQSRSPASVSVWHS